MRDFDDLYNRYSSRVRSLARVQKVPGLDTDDIEAEMLLCLWKAADTFDPTRDLDFGAYWWTLWLNRRSDIAEAFFAQKRPRIILWDADVSVTEDLPAAPISTIPPCPTQGRADGIIWTLLAQGATAQEAMQAAEVSKNGYYRVIGQWRSDAVRRYLAHPV